MNERNQADKLKEAIVLAGGHSTRMGRDKALLTIEGQPLLVRLASRLQKMGMNVTIAAGSEERARLYGETLQQAGSLQPGVRFVTDAFPDCGPMAGLHAALSAIQQGYAFVIACDMPNLSAAYIERLSAQLGQAAHADAAADFIGADGQPFHALYHTNAAQAIARHLAEGRYRMMGLPAELRRDLVEPEGEAEAAAFHNVNTPASYRSLLENQAE